MVTLFFQTCSRCASVAAWSSVEIIAKDSLEEHRKWQRIAWNKHNIYKHSNLKNPQTSGKKDTCLILHVFQTSTYTLLQDNFAGGTPGLGTITMSSHDFWCHIMWSSNPWGTSISRHDMTCCKKTTYPKHSFWLISKLLLLVYFSEIYISEALRWENMIHLTQKNILEAKIHCECFGFTIWQLFSNAKINQLQIALRIQHHLDLGSVVSRRLMDVGNRALEQKHSYVSKMCSNINMQSLCKKCDRGFDTWM